MKEELFHVHTCMYVCESVEKHARKDVENHGKSHIENSFFFFSSPLLF